MITDASSGRLDDLDVRRQVRTWTILAVVVLPLSAALCGCSGGAWDWGWERPAPVDEPALRVQALNLLKQCVAFPQSATVRCHAIEALAEDAPTGAEGWFIEALGDDNPVVRFAACLALGRVRHLPAKTVIEQRLGDENPNVRAAAIFALHRMGDHKHINQLAEMLLHHKSKEVRANAATMFGLLGEPSAIKLLTRARRDPAQLVVWQALESRLLLKDPKALAEVGHQANSGREDIRVLAILALGKSGNRRSAEVLRYRLNKKEDHLQPRLAAARALGHLGYQDGLELARRSLKFDDPNPDPRAGDPQDQIMQVRTMAALALGAMGARSVLPDLKSLMADSDDYRIKVAAARAIIQIVPGQEWRGPKAKPKSASPDWRPAPRLTGSP